MNGIFYKEFGRGEKLTLGYLYNELGNWYASSIVQGNKTKEKLWKLILIWGCI